MPNLNLKNDTPDDDPEQSEMTELEEESPSIAGSSLIKALPLVTGGLIALLLSFYILNKVGILHVWGPKKASSVMVSVPVDSAAQVLSDSVMAEQFRRDSAEAVNAASSRQPSRPQTRAEIKKAAAEKQAAADRKQAEQKLAEKKQAEQKLAEQKLADKKQAEQRLAEQKQAAEAKRLEQQKIAANAKRAEDERQAAAAAAKKQEAMTAAAAKRNATTIEVQGVQRGRAAEPAVQERAQARSTTVRVERKAPARIAAEKTPAAVTPDAVKKPARDVRAAVPAKEAEEAKTGAGEPSVYTVQLSSWMSAAKAQALASKFKSAGIPAFVYTEGHVHRVCTGRFATQEAATARAEELVPMLETKYDIITVK